MRRRSYCLALGSVGLTGLAGCLDTMGAAIGSGNGGHVRPEEDPDTLPADFVCDQEGFDPHWAGYSEKHLYWGDVDDYSMRVNALEFEYGDSVEITLSATDRGSDYKFNFEIFTKNGWRDVRVITDEDAFAGYDDIGVLDDAEWTFELTEDGIIDDIFEPGKYQDSLEVCPNLVTARYRFVYWGLLGDDSIAVAFDIDV